jgi:hypothetical protein
MEDGQVRRPVLGTPQGGVISPLLCNVYLHRIDRSWDVHGVIVRFADDVVVMCKSRDQAEAALARLRAVLAELGLEPKEAKTRIVRLEVGGAGFDFLGFHRRLVRVVGRRSPIPAPCHNLLAESGLNSRMSGSITSPSSSVVVLSKMREITPDSSTEFMQGVTARGPLRQGSPGQKSSVTSS